MFTVEDADGDDIVVELTNINPPSDSPFGKPFIISATSPTTCKHLYLSLRNKLISMSRALLFTGTICYSMNHPKNNKCGKKAEPGVRVTEPSIR